MGEKRKKGFACMTPERRAEIAAMGGRSVPPEKRAFSKNRGVASRAGMKGGRAASENRKHGFSDHECAVRAGKASAAARKAKKEYRLSQPV